MATSGDGAFLFDLDGTLVDSVYQHVLAWREALEAAGIKLSVWRIHRRIGMSGAGGGRAARTESWMFPGGGRGGGGPLSRRGGGGGRGCGFAPPPAARARWGGGCWRADTPSMSWTGPAPTGCTPFPPIYSAT